MSFITKFVHFTMEWEIQFSEFDAIQHRPLGIRKDFVTAYNNIPLRWHVQIRQDTDDNSKLRFYMQYDEGPMNTIDGVMFGIAIVGCDGTMPFDENSGTNSLERGYGRSWWTNEDNNSEVVRTKYGLIDTDRLKYQITVKIPIEAFSFTMPIPPPSKPPSTCLIDLFSMIDDQNNPSFSDVKLISRDDVVYNCYKGIIAVQSEPLATMFTDPLAALTDRAKPTELGAPIDRHVAATETKDATPPPTQETNGSTSVAEDPSKKKRKKDEYDFPTMAAASLKSLIEYFYTGKATMTNLSVSEVIELPDAAEQYALKPLKESCGVELWKRVVDEPRMAFQIARFADLHDDMKWLKDRAFEVIVENWDGSTRDLADQFGGTRRKKLHREFDNYMACRLRPYFKP